MRKRIVAYHQLESSDCGLTCVRIMARYWGKRVSNKRLREMADMSRLGVTIRDMRRILGELGLEATAAKLSVEQAEQMPLPAILHWEQKHYVVLYEVNAKKGLFKIADPGNGKLIVQREDFERAFCGFNDRGIAILAGPDDTFTPTSEGEIARIGAGLVKMVGKAFMDYRKRFALIIGLSVVGLLAEIAMPFIFQRTIDEGIANKDIHLVWLLVFSQLAIFLGNYVSNWVVQFVLTKLGLQIGIKMLNEYLAKLIKLPMAFFARKVNSDLIQKAEDRNRLKTFMVGVPDRLFFTVVNLFVFSGLLVYFNLYIFLIFMSFTVLGFVWNVIFARKRRMIDYGLYSAMGENRNNLHEIVHGIDEIKINNAQSMRIGVWNTVQERSNRLSVRSAWLQFYANGGSALLARLRDISITGVSATLVIMGKMTIGEMMTVSYIAGMLVRPFANLVSGFNEVQDAAMSYERVDEIMNAEEEPDGLPAPRDVDVVLKNVSFKYPGGASPMVLQGIDMVIPHGKITAIVGRSGCGKTTLIKLILGLFRPAEGVVEVGGKDLRTIDSGAWMEQCGVVMQNGRIFSGTLMSNVALADPHPDAERVEEAMRVACFDDFLRTLPMGLHTRIGVVGIDVSGGQKQRLLIARAVYKNPSILILDEATSSLDAINEAQIVRNLDEFQKGRTVIVAAHRLSTVKRADQIVMMDKGRIVETGTHHELLERKGMYHELVRNQLDLD